MTISMSEQSHADLDQELCAQVQYPDPKDKLDLLFHQPSWLSTGYIRNIILREGLELVVHNYRLCDHWKLALPEREQWLSFHFHLSGEHQDAYTEVSNLEYALYGSGLAPKQTITGSERYPILEVHIWMSSQVLVSFVGNDGEPPLEFRHLICQPNQKYYTRVGTTYEIQQGALQGLEFGLGFFFVGERQGDLANTFQVPSYFRTDASISYNRGQFRAALNFRNLFDVEYFESAFTRLRLYPGDPFTVQGTISWQF